MKFLPLIWAALWRKKTRTVFTLLSIVVAFLLFGMLQGVNAAFNSAVDRANVNRLMVANATAFTESLPYAYLTQIESVPGVSAVSQQSWFGGYYQDPKNFVFSFPVEPLRWRRIGTEYRIPEDQFDAWVRTRTGAVVGAQLAAKYGWKIGDRVPLHSVIWTKAGGGSDWEFDIVGIFTSPEFASRENQFLFNYSYFDEARVFGKGRVGWLVVQVADPRASARIAAAIDHLFANSPDETETKTEKEFQQSFLKQIGDINFIVTRILFAVFFSLLFATGSSLMQSMRERIPELAVLKTVGFTDAGVLRLVLAESVMLCVLAALAGLAAAALLFPALRDAIGVVTLPRAVLAEGVVIAVLLALATGLLPAWRARRLSIVDALAGR
ncbi:MAG: ABC transporter permease [Proteobacteria bacterium]|nr:ABC transporter permease [Pseudomonadota bacterium]